MSRISESWGPQWLSLTAGKLEIGLQQNPLFWITKSQQHLNRTKFIQYNLLSYNCTPPSVNSKAGHNISIATHCANLQQQSFAAVERSAHQLKYTLPWTTGSIQKHLKYRCLSYYTSFRAIQENIARVQGCIFMSPMDK